MCYADEDGLVGGIEPAGIKYTEAGDVSSSTSISAGERNVAQLTMNASVTRSTTAQIVPGADGCWEDLQRSNYPEKREGYD